MKKDVWNTQFARVCNAVFGRNNPTASPDDGIEPLADGEGRLIVLPSTNGPGGIVNNAVSLFVTNISLLPNGGQLLWDATGGVLRRFELFFGFNQHATQQQFLQLHLSQVTPGAGAIPFISIPVPPAFSTYSLSGRFQFNPPGLFAVPSTTALTYTAPALSGLTIQTQFFDSNLPFTYQ